MLNKKRVDQYGGGTVIGPGTGYGQRYMLKEGRSIWRYDGRLYAMLVI